MLIPSRGAAGSTSARWLRTAIGLVGIGAFWVGVAIAATRYPSPFDWRYMTVSSLLAPDRNPAGYFWSTAGVVACGLCGFVWATLSARSTRRLVHSERPTGLRAFQLGFLATSLSAALPDALLPVPKIHEFFAVVAFAALTRALVGTFQTSVMRWLERSGRTGRVLGVAAVGAVIAPMFIAAAVQAYVFFVHPEWPWVNVSWRERGVPWLISFAFWEWITCAVLALYMAFLLVLMQEASAPAQLAAVQRPPAP